MHRLLVTSLALISTLGLSAAAPLPKWAAFTPGRTPVRVAVETTDPRYQHLSWPKMLRASDGAIVVAFVAGESHWDGGSPAVSISHDNGRTFSPPHILKSFGKGDPLEHCGNIALGRADDGALLVLAMALKRDMQLKRDERNLDDGIFGWRSTDNGVTWEATDTSALAATGSVFGNIVPVPGKGMMATGHYREHPAQTRPDGLWRAFSADGGKSWQPPAPLAPIPAAEPVVIVTGQTLIGMGRGSKKGKDEGRPFQLLSKDLGETWTADLFALQSTEPDNVHVTLAAPFVIEDPKHPGRLIALTTERRRKGEGPYGRIWLWTADAGTLGWKRERLLLETPDLNGNPHTDFGYPWLTSLEDDRWLMIWYHGNKRGRSPIWATEVRIDAPVAP